MVKCKSLKEFSLRRFNEIQNLIRADENKNSNGWIYVNDTFECELELAEYLTGKNEKKIVAVKIIEVIPEKKEEIKPEEKPVDNVEKIVDKPKRTRRKKKNIE